MSGSGTGHAPPPEGNLGERLARAERALEEALASVSASAGERDRLREELDHARRAREETAGILSHDLRNPLSAMLIGVQRLERLVEGPRREQALAVIERLERSIRGMNRLVEEVVDLSRLEGGTLALHPRAEPVRALLERAVEPFAAEAAERSQRIALECPGDLPAVGWDPDRIAQAVGQLLANAIRYGPEGGDIRVRAAPDAAGVRFEVRDEGPGISGDQRGHLFDRWWRPPEGAAPRGHGLGLFLVRGIVEAHGGRAWVESEEGRGSTFLFTLPLATP